jgi:hypothetical protein
MIKKKPGRPIKVHRKRATRLFLSEIRGFPSSLYSEFGFHLNPGLLPEFSQIVSFAIRKKYTKVL